MPAKISLREIVDQLGSAHEEFTAFLNKKTGEIVTISNQDLELGEAEGEEEREAANVGPIEDDIADAMPEWQREAVQQARLVLGSQDFIALPDPFDIDEWRIMQEFCSSQTDAERRDLLLGAIRGAGAFNRFKSAIHRLGTQQNWYEFKNRKLKMFAKGWLEEHHVAYVDDTAKPPGDV